LARIEGKLGAVYSWVLILLGWTQQRPIVRPWGGDPALRSWHFIPAKSLCPQKAALSLTKSPARRGGLTMGRGPAALLTGPPPLT